MGDDPSLLQAVLAAPRDHAPRLVYADWLDEHGDPRGTYLRLGVQLAGLRRTGKKASALRRQLHEVRVQLDRRWLARMEQPDALLANPTPFPTAWFATDLGDYRPCDGTYAQYRYDEQPPLPVDRVSADFAWLRNAPLIGGEPPIGPPACSDWKKAGRDVVRQARKLGLTLPEEYRNLIRYPERVSRVPSCTACWFEWPGQRLTITESPAGEDAYLVPFYSDSQDCVLWFLYLHRRGDHCVVASHYPFGNDWGDEPTGNDKDQSVWFCSPSLSTFLYRWWLENSIWYATNGEQPRRSLTDEEQCYVAHFQARPARRSTKRPRR